MRPNWAPLARLRKCAAAETRNAVVAKIGIHDVLLEPAIKSAIIEMGLVAIGSTPDEFAAVIAAITYAGVY